MLQSINVYVTMQIALLLILTVPVINVTGAQSTVHHDRVIHVHKNGNNNESCLTGQDTRQGKGDKYCETMGFIADELRSRESRNVTIIVETPIIVAKVIAFKNHNDLTIQGRGKGTYLNCKCDKESSASIGILFTDIKGLKLKQFNVMKCCGIHTIDKHQGRAGVLIKNCSDVTVVDSRIYNNDFSNGLILFNPSGFVTIQHSTFLNNGISKYNKASTTGAGLHIELSHCIPKSTTEITISGCNFTHNKSPGQKNSINATSLPLNVTKSRIWRRESIGGGMAIVLLSGVNSTKINVFNCTFVNNNATWGGELCIYMQRGTHDNTIAISNSTVEKNYAQWGGGGLQIRLEELNKSSQNYITVEGVIFKQNYAKVFGGGTSVSALLVSYEPQPGETLRFSNCTWYRNGAQYNSAAVDLSPYSFQQSKQGYSPVPLFKDITIQGNYANTSSNNYSVVQGVFVVTRFTVHFQGSIRFQDNHYTALYLTLGRACSLYKV